MLWHAQVKLAEALERCERVSPATVTTGGEEKPNRLKTAVCCQLLGEFAALCGPFSGALKSLRDELVRAEQRGHVPGLGVRCGLLYVGGRNH